VRGADIFTNRITDGGEERGLVSFGKRGPWRKRMSFSQEDGQFVVAWFIGFISMAKGCDIDREAAALSCTSFLSDRRGRG
jgi:hypothetical protein